MDEVTARIDHFCDVVPRQWATVTDDGPLRLFTRTTPGFPFYARPIPDAVPVERADVDRMRSVQRDRGVPEAFEWIVEAAPAMADAVADSGLAVQVCPLLVLDGEPRPAPLPPRHTARFLGPVDGDLAAAAAVHLTVASVAFGSPVPAAPSGETVAQLAADLAAGRVARLLVTGPDGPVAVGSAQRSGDVVELVGIATTDGFRGRGLGAAVTSRLARIAVDTDADVVFLSAADEAASRVYERVGFRRVGESGIAAP
jgi:ribosomal protein S18 acetylase RimI-like enzyme